MRSYPLETEQRHPFPSRERTGENLSQGLGTNLSAVGSEIIF